mgnify:FL=1
MTFAFWIYREGDGCSSPRVFQFGDGSKENDLSGGHFVLGWANGEKRIFIEHSSAGISHRDYNWGSDLDDRTWYHIAYSDDTLYVNGQSVTTIPTPGFDRTLTSISIGGNDNGSINGYMADFRITNGLARYTANFTPPTSSLKG